MKTSALRFSVLASSLTCLLACSPKNSDSSSSTAPTAQRGDLISKPTLVAAYGPSDLLGLLSGNDLGKVLLQLAVSPVCTIGVYHMQYQTADPAGDITPA